MLREYRQNSFNRESSYINTNGKLKRGICKGTAMKYENQKEKHGNENEIL